MPSQQDTLDQLALAMAAMVAPTLSPLKRRLGEGAVVYCPLGLEAIRV